MSIPAVLSFAAAYFSLILAAVVLLRDKHAFVHRVFAAGMVLFAAEEICRGLGYSAILPAAVIYWQKRVMVISVLIPGVWLGFSVSYARVRSSESLSKWKGLVAAFVARGERDIRGGNGGISTRGAQLVGKVTRGFGRVSVAVAHKSPARL